MTASASVTALCLAGSRAKVSPGVPSRRAGAGSASRAPNGLQRKCGLRSPRLLGRPSCSNSRCIRTGPPDPQGRSKQSEGLRHCSLSLWLKGRCCVSMVRVGGEPQAVWAVQGPCSLNLGRVPASAGIWGENGLSRPARVRRAVQGENTAAPASTYWAWAPVGVLGST